MKIYPKQLLPSALRAITKRATPCFDVDFVQDDDKKHVYVIDASSESMRNNIMNAPPLSDLADDREVLLFTSTTPPPAPSFDIVGYVGIKIYSTIGLSIL